MKNEMNAKQIKQGARCILLDKFRNEIADDIVVSNDGKRIELANGDVFLVRHIGSVVSGSEIQVTLTVSGSF